MRAVDLRRILTTLLSTELGTYTNGVPSVWVYGSSSQPPSSSNGLECLIKETPDVAACPTSAGTKYKPQLWEVTLRNWTRTSNLAIALTKIEKRFIVRRYTHLPAASDTLEQSRIFIFDPIVI
ncbi:MAG: hypothetical protein ACKPA7_13280 [Sphaerospermopsis kisseleviana]